MRWGLVCALLLLASPARADGLTEQLFDYFSDKKNYKQVRRDVLEWHGTTRNGCVAFVSTALRHVGMDIPVRGKRDGWGISRITFAFSDYLEQEHAWTKMTDVAELVPGDIVFTDGYPDHVFLFHSWNNERKRIAVVIDNQGFAIRRRLRPKSGSDVAAFSYALRPPKR